MHLISASSPIWFDETNEHIWLTAEFEGQKPMSFLATRGAGGHVGEIFGRAEAGEFGSVADYVPPPLDEDVVAHECQRRIFAVASANAQMNMTAWLASGMASEADKAAFARSLLWVQDMRAAYAAIIEKQDRGFGADDRWPPCPPDVVEIASRF
jgi:hypothetical protein